jgi:excisionase family DNA binding protein
MREKDLSHIYVGTVLAARQLGVTTVTVQRWSDAKRLRSVRYGGRRLLFRADVEALAAERERAKVEAAMKK